MSVIEKIYDRKIFNKTPYQVFLQLDRYTVKDLNAKIKVGNIVVGIYDETNLEKPKKDFGEVLSVEGDFVTFRGEMTGKEYKVHKRYVTVPLDYKWEDTVDRFEKGIMAVEQNYPGHSEEDKKEFAKRIRHALYHEKIVPGGRIQALLGAKEKYGIDLKLTAYNCHVIPSPLDSRKGIVETLGNMIEIMSRSGGVGVNISTLRPRHSKVFGVNGTSSGAVSWGGMFSYATGLIEQGGSRRGALMEQLHCTHPDIFEFITAKKEMGKITNANLSVQITKEFLEAVKQDKEWHLIFPYTKHPDYDKKWGTEYLDIHDWLKAGLPVEIYKTVKAKDLFRTIYESAWASGEPGFVIYDNMNDGNMVPTQILKKTADGLYVLDKKKVPNVNAVPWNNTFYFQKNVATNPCGEQPLAPWGVCNLIHVNLAEFYDAKTNDVKWDELKQVVHDAVRMADDIIDYTPYFFPENEKIQKGQRRIGLGTMGLHDLLIDLKMVYGLKESVKFIDKLFGFIKNEAYRASALLAEKRGTFPNYSPKILKARVPSSLDEDVKELIKLHGLRNSHLLTQAPTGTTATKTGKRGYSVSTGIEPYFALKWERNSRLGTAVDYLGKAKEYLERTGEKTLPEYFVSAMGTVDGKPQITPEMHIAVQAAIQKHTDSAISKTVNVPEYYTPEEIGKLYMLALESDLVGITVYRDKSRDEQVLSAVEEDKADKKETEKKPQLYRRPPVLDAKVYKIMTPFGKGYVSVGRHPENGNIEEFLFKLAKHGSDISAIGDGMAIAMTGMFSPRIYNLSEEEKIRWLIKKYSGISGQSSIGFGKNKVESLPDAIAQVLQMIIENADGKGNEGQQEKQNNPDIKKESIAKTIDICPNCGQATLVKQEGCATCLPDIGGCGYSKC